MSGTATIDPNLITIEELIQRLKAFHTLGRRYGIPSYGMERSYYPYTAHAMECWKNEYKKQMTERGIPILELDLEYRHAAGAQVRIRAEAFMEMLESRAG
jgi:hypothetical protein